MVLLAAYKGFLKLVYMIQMMKLGFNDETSFFFLETSNLLEFSHPIVYRFYPECQKPLKH